MNTCDRFPYQNFPIRLEYKEIKDKKLCFFECEEHLKKYINRHKLKTKDLTIEYKSDKVKSKSVRKTKKADTL
jgi:hypothetical protein